MKSSKGFARRRRRHTSVNRRLELLAAFEDSGMSAAAFARQQGIGYKAQNLAVTPDGKLLLCANLAGNNIAVFRIDSETGRLTAVGVPVSVTSPSCIRVLF